MEPVDTAWATEQMAQTKVRQGVAASVIALLDTWNETEHKTEDSSEVLDLFSKLAMTRSLISDNPDEVWVEARPGFLRVGDQVRVKNDAYVGKTGTMHNGRRGKVVAIRYGDIVFRSTDDREPFLDGTHHAPYKLEKRIK